MRLVLQPLQSRLKVGTGLQRNVPRQLKQKAKKFSIKDGSQGLIPFIDPSVTDSRKVQTRWKMTRGERNGGVTAYRQGCHDVGGFNLQVRRRCWQLLSDGTIITSSEVCSIETLGIKVFESDFNIRTKRRGNGNTAVALKGSTAVWC